ncbi:MAG: ATP-binding protein [Bacteroidales bacterium]|nr:ATP-binding protein [Bacteroidales bacterium]
MKELLKEMIIDAQSGSLFTGTTRHLKPTRVNNKATIIIGVRRSGKSTLLHQIAANLMLEGVSKENILYLNFFDDRLSNLYSFGLDMVLQSFYSLYPHKKSQETIYCFFDEIQNVPGWEAYVDRILRTENVVVYISGSSAQMLSKEIATQMRGRALSWELFPFSFKEYTDHLTIKNDLPLNSQQRHFIENAYQSYWNCGGFPEVVGLEKSLRIKVHQEYFDSILFRDLIERYDISHPRALVDLAKNLLENIASMYTINSLTGFLKSLGYNVPKSSVSEYLKWFEDAYFLYTVRLFDASFRRSNANSKKIYCVDHALIRSVSSGILTNTGHILENIIFLAIRRLTADIFYYKTKGNLEVDFVFNNAEGKLILLQVCETLVNPTTRMREINALKTAMIELNVNTGFIITQKETESIRLESGIIEIIPVWKYLLIPNL